MAIFGDSKPRLSEEYDIGSNSSQHTERMQVGVFGGTSHDASEMHRMGRKQELRVLPHQSQWIIFITDCVSSETSA